MRCCPLSRSVYLNASCHSVRSLRFDVPEQVGSHHLHSLCVFLLAAALISPLKIYTKPRKILFGLLHLTASPWWYWNFYLFIFIFILHVWPAGTVNREIQLKVLYEAFTPGVLFMGLCVLRSIQIWKQSQQAHLLIKRKTGAFEIPQAWNCLPFTMAVHFKGRN